MYFTGPVESSSSANNLNGSEPRDDVRPIGSSPRTDQYVALLSAYLADAASLRSPATVVERSSPASPSLPADDSSPVAEDLTDDGSYLLHFLGLESLRACSEGQVTDNAGTSTDVPTDQKPTIHKDSDESFNGSHQDDSFKNPNNGSSSQSEVGAIHCNYSGGSHQDWNIHNTSFNRKDLHTPPYRGFNYRVLYYPDHDPIHFNPSIMPYYPVNDHIAPNPDDLCAKIVRQIEYYFSFDNLIKDSYFRQHMDHQGWVPIQFIAALPEMRELTNSPRLIVEALRTSLAMEILDDKKIRPRYQQAWDQVY
ncbi:la-related protein 1B-like [Neltuma alba]|uniref:la-related protein 1B-like n=1 Tax=Neltuma alba TaxID=207710 RepID=UPI0010A2DEBF|nr:la-related protein 1B-like [Prosopis alba]